MSISAHGESRLPCCPPVLHGALTKRECRRARRRRSRRSPTLRRLRLLSFIAAAARRRGVRVPRDRAGRALAADGESPPEGACTRPGLLDREKRGAWVLLSREPRAARGAACRLGDARSSRAERASARRESSAGIADALAQRVVAEGVGTALLLATVVGLGDHGRAARRRQRRPWRCSRTRSRPARCWCALILTFGPISGAQFNPAVTLAVGVGAWVAVARGAAVTSRRKLVGALVGVAVADLMFDLPRVLPLAARADGAVAVAERVRCDVRSARRSFGAARACAPRTVVPVRRRRLHHRGLLVHGVHVVRQPGRDARALAHRYVRGHSADRRAGVRRARSSLARRPPRRAVPLVEPGAAGGGADRRGARGWSGVASTEAR